MKEENYLVIERNQETLEEKVIWKTEERNTPLETARKAKDLRERVNRMRGTSHRYKVFVRSSPKIKKNKKKERTE